MSFNRAITHQEMVRLASFTETAEQINLEAVFHSDKPIAVEDDSIPVKQQEGNDDVLDQFPSGDRFTRSGLDLLEYTAHQSLDFHKTIQDSHRPEEYPCDYSRIRAKLNRERASLTFYSHVFS